MSASVLRADARNLPLPDGSVDLIVTSPPYYGLRSYTDGGEHYAGQIGDEVTPGEYIANLLACTAEWVRVLKPEGSIFVVIGDKYSGYSGENWGHGRDLGRTERSQSRVPISGPRSAPGVYSIPNKSLMGLPWRYAIGCIDRLGLILRAEIIWAKPNGLPESVTDRGRRAHEQVFHFTKQPRYYSAVDEIREPTQPIRADRWHGATWVQRKEYGEPGRNRGGGSNDIVTATPSFAANPLGKLPGSVWQIPSAPLTVPPHLGVDHFAAYPPALVRPIVLGWSPPGVCAACGQGRRPVSAVGARVAPATRRGRILDAELGVVPGWRFADGPNPPVRTITGYACACPQPIAPARPSLVVDPFGGTGTTALVASVHGRHGITADLSADYCRLARWRVSDPGERARAMDVPKPPPVSDSQGELFAMP